MRTDGVWKWLGVAALAAALGGGCASSDKENCPKIDLTADTGTINKVCPVVMEDGIGKNAPRRQWKGQTVGFCCDDCVPTWDGWSEAKKDDALARAIAKSQ